MEENDLRGELEKVFSNLNPEDTESLAAVGHEARSLILQTAIPEPVTAEIRAAYQDLVPRIGNELSLAVRSSASAEDLPEASFADSLNLPH